MNKKQLAVLALLFFGVFVLSGCRLLPGKLETKPLENNKEEAASSVVESFATTTQDEALVATTSSKNYQEGIDYSLDYPTNYFVEKPVVSEIDCDISKECPCIIGSGYEDEDDFCSRVATSSRQGDLCVQKWSEGAVGSFYTTYIYTKALASSTGRCSSLKFTKRTVSSCSVYEGDKVKVKNCEAENAMVPVMIDRIVSSWKMPAASSTSSLLKDSSKKVLEALKNKDMKSLASFVGSGKLCFSPYANIGAGANCFFGSELSAAMDDKLEYIWGAYDGSGEQIVLNFADYYGKFIYNKDYVEKGEYFFGDPVSRGNTLNNMKEIYPNSLFSEFYIAPSDKSGLDWSSIRFVFDEVGGALMLKAIVHDQWTI